MKVLILGCGPAGLFAAHAANELDHDVTIWSKKRRSEMYGAQNLLQPVPGLTDEQGGFKVSYGLAGTWEQYRAKVYGEGLVYGENEATKGEYAAWDIRDAYYRAWQLYGSSVVKCFQPIDAEELTQYLFRHMPDAVVSTIPAPALCKDRQHHSFASQDIWAVGDAPERGIFAPQVMPLNTIAYSGNANTGWHRAANLCNYHTMEWPINTKPPVDDVAQVTKPIATNCDCWLKPNGNKGSVGNIPVLKVGRYGAWDRNKHSHHAYYETFEFLQSLRGKRSLVRRLMGNGGSI